jgi:hypothetical protein
MHLVGFFTLAYWMLSNLEIIFYTWQKIALAIVLTIIGFVIGHVYEGARFIFFKEPTNNLDAILSGIGFSLGTILVLIKNDITFISTYMFYFCLGLFVIDTAWAIYRKVKK